MTLYISYVRDSLIFPFIPVLENLSNRAARSAGSVKSPVAKNSTSCEAEQLRTFWLLIPYWPGANDIALLTITRHHRRFVRNTQEEIRTSSTATKCNMTIHKNPEVTNR